MNRTTRKVTDMLRATGLPYRLRGGHKHTIVYLDDKMIGSFNHHADDFNGCVREIEKRIRRYCNETLA